MRYRSSERTIINILSAITENKELAQYDMKNAIGKDYRTVLRYLPKLESCRLIQLSRTEHSKKKGKDRKIYTVTLIGIIELLKTQAHYTSDFISLVDKLAVKYPTLLPLVFGKWHLFEQNNQKILVALKLRDVVRQASSHLNELTGNSKGLYRKVQAINRARAQRLDQETFDSEEKENHEFMEKLENKGCETVATGQAAIEALIRVTSGCCNDLERMEKEVTESTLLGWDIRLDGYGNLDFDELINAYFRVLRKDNELRSYVDQKLLEREHAKEQQLELTRKFTQWWKKLNP
jgi:hypothetical protein